MQRIAPHFPTTFIGSKTDKAHTAHHSSRHFAITESQQGRPTRKVNKKSRERSRADSQKGRQHGDPIKEKPKGRPTRKPTKEATKGNPTGKATQERQKRNVLVHMPLAQVCSASGSPWTQPRLLAMALVLRPEDVNTDTTHRDASFPDPCLECAKEFEFRVYVLECGGESGRPYYYVGFEHRSDVGARVRKHFTGNGACYTKERKPKRIILVWPVRHAAAEAYVFALLLSTFPAASIDRLGGWTQTSVRPSPLCRQQFEEQRRCLRSLCFRCGGRHFASACEKPVQGVQYKCPNCDCALLISSRGQSVTAHAKGA